MGPEIMSLGDEYLKYTKRRYGMDHDRYQWSILQKRKPVTWPGGAKVALWVVPALEFFPLDQSAKPFKAPGGMVTPYPDLRHYTLRDYGNRVGVFRVFEVLDGLGIKASVAVNSKVAERYPFLIHEIGRRGWEIIAHGVDMGRLHYGGMDEAEEAAPYRYRGRRSPSRGGRSRGCGAWNESRHSRSRWDRACRR